MPKRKHDLTKTERIRILLELFERNRNMLKGEIDNRLSAIVGVPVKDLKQSTYRDLKWLVDKGLLSVRHRMPSGTIVRDTGERQKEPHRSEWYLPDADSDEFPGSSLVAEMGAMVLSSDRLKNKFRFVDSNALSREGANRTNFEFIFQGRVICLLIDFEAAPFTLIIGRNKNLSQDHANHLQAIERNFGRRVIALYLPIPDLSGFRDPSRPGHCAIEVLGPDNSAVLTDLNSTNRTLIDPKKDFRITAGPDSLFGYETFNLEVKPFEILAVPMKPTAVELPFGIRCASLHVVVSRA